MNEMNIKFWYMFVPSPTTETKLSVDYTSQWPYASRGKKYTEQVIPNNMNDL